MLPVGPDVRRRSIINFFVSIAVNFVDEENSNGGVTGFVNYFVIPALIPLLEEVDLFLPSLVLAARN